VLDSGAARQLGPTAPERERVRPRPVEPPAPAHARRFAQSPPLTFRLPPAVSPSCHRLPETTAGAALAGCGAGAAG